MLLCQMSQHFSVLFLEYICVYDSAPGLINNHEVKIVLLEQEAHKNL